MFENIPKKIIGGVYTPVGSKGTVYFFNYGSSVAW
jgi:hypothetical protein